MKTINILLISMLAFLFLLTSCSLIFGSFEKTSWMANKNNTGLDNPRAGMIADLENNYLNVGMNKEKVVEILGEPDGKETSSDGGEVFVYDLGFPGFTGIDSEWYKVFFDKNNKVIRLWREQG